MCDQWRKHKIRPFQQKRASFFIFILCVSHCRCIERKKEPCETDMIIIIILVAVDIFQKELKNIKKSFVRLPFFRKRTLASKACKAWVSYTPEIVLLTDLKLNLKISRNVSCKTPIFQRRRTLARKKQEVVK